MKSIKLKMRKSPLLAFRFTKQRQKIQFVLKIDWRTLVEGEPNFSFTTGGEGEIRTRGKGLPPTTV